MAIEEAFQAKEPPLYGLIGFCSDMIVGRGLLENRSANLRRDLLRLGQ